MTVDDLKALLDAGRSPVVLDVREAPELRIASFPFPVVHIPMGRLAARVTELPRDRTVVCACRSGSRSAQAAAWLKRQGFDAENLDGGILAWSRRIDPSIPQY